ncbi:hypothetical protein [Thiorhodococcus minor]|nr:hypothetical protein [Thiorhodococcus minor]
MSPAFGLVQGAEALGVVTPSFVAEVTKQELRDQNSGRQLTDTS